MHIYHIQIPLGRKNKARPEIKRDFSGGKNRKNMRVEENKYEMQNKAE